MSPPGDAHNQRAPTGSEDAFFSNRLAALLFAAVVALYVAARLWKLTASCLWFDEIFGVHAARHGWQELIHFVAADIIHPPLFYLLLKIWIGLGGESLLWLRLFPALFSIAVSVPFVLLCRELRLKSGEVTLALLLVAVNGYLIKYAQELRMYSVLLFFATCSLWLFLRFMNRKPASRSDLLIIGAVNFFLVYTHYAGWVVVLLQVIALATWKRERLRAFLGSVVVLILGFLPWIYAIATAAEPGRGLGQNIGWVSRPYLPDLLHYFLLLNRPFLFAQSTSEVGYNLWVAGLTLLLFGVPLAAFAWRALRASNEEGSKRRKPLAPLFILAFAPALLMLVLSWILPYSVWGTRHLIISAVPYALLAAIALKSLRAYWVRATIFAVIGLWFLLSGMVSISTRAPVFIWCAWEPLAQQMRAVEASANRQVKVYAFEDLVAYHLWFSLDETFDVAVVKNVAGLQEDPAYFLPRRFRDITVLPEPALEGEDIWIAFRADRWDETRPPLSFAGSRGYRVGRVLSRQAQRQEAFLVQMIRR